MCVCSLCKGEMCVHMKAKQIFPWQDYIQCRRRNFRLHQATHIRKKFASFESLKYSASAKKKNFQRVLGLYRVSCEDCVTNVCRKHTSHRGLDPDADTAGRAGSVNDLMDTSKLTSQRQARVKTK